LSAKFSELLEEYLDLREAGEPYSEWVSSSRNGEDQAEYRRRLRELLMQMDELVERKAP
jgi:hypothetical protein